MDCVCVSQLFSIYHLRELHTQNPNPTPPEIQSKDKRKSTRNDIDCMRSRGEFENRCPRIETLCILCIDHHQQGGRREASQGSSCKDTVRDREEISHTFEIIFIARFCAFRPSDFYVLREYHRAEGFRAKRNNMFRMTGEGGRIMRVVVV